MAQPALSLQQQASLATICATGADRLNDLATRLTDAQFMIRRAQIEAFIVGQVGEDAGIQLTAFLFGLAVGARQDSSAPIAMLKTIDERLGSTPGDKLRFEGWQECRTALIELLASKSIRAAAKALEVSYDFERIYQEGRFITSVRPVFDDPRETILGATIVQTLRIDYASAASGESSSLSIALDRADIEQLKRACEEALRKGDVALRSSSGPWGLATLMPGEDAA